MITQIKSQNIQSILPFFVIDYEGNIIEARNVTSIGIQSKKLPIHVGIVFCEKNTEILLETIHDFQVKRKKSIQVELVINHHSKATWYLFTCTKHQIETKDCVYVTIQNIHSYKQQILQLQTSLNKQKKELQRVKQISDFNAAVINNANAIIVALDKNGTILKFSKNAEKISGYAKKEVIGKKVLDVFVPESVFPNEHATLQKLIQNKENGSFYEAPLLTKSGIEKIISWENRKITSINSDIAMVCIGKDITELRLNAQKLTDSESRFRELAKTLPLAIICVDRSGNILFMNQAYTHLFGYGATELTSVNDIIYAFYESKEIIKKAKLRWQKDLSNDYHKPIQTRTIHVRCKNGQYKDIEVNGALNNQNLYYSYTDITYRLQFEKDLIEGKEYFKKVAENTPVPVAIGNLKMETVFVNKAFTKILGYKIDDIPKVQSSNPYFVFNNEEESKLLTQEWFEIAEAYIHTGQLLKQTIYRSIICKNGTIKHFEISFSIEDELLYSIFIDITDKRKVQELLLQSEQKFKKVAENIPLPMVCYTKQMEFIFTNQQFTKLFGLNMSNLDTYAHWLSRFVYSNAQVEAKELQELASAIEGFQTNTQTITPIFERSIKDANDAVRVFELAFTVQEDLVYMILNDVSEKIETKKLLQKSEYRFRNIAENAPLAILTFDEEMNITYVNEQFKNILGYSLEDVTENGVWQKFIVYTNDAERVHSEREWKTSIERLRTRKLQQAESLERTIVCKNGENRIFEISFTADDHLVYAILDDITERKTSEQRLFESEQRFKALADNLPIAIGSHHVDGTILFLNNHFVKT
ncbi:MAG: PAS domain S-box protein, partial [Chitinophagaceae bacterium]